MIYLEIKNKTTRALGYSKAKVQSLVAFTIEDDKNHNGLFLVRNNGEWKQSTERKRLTAYDDVLALKVTEAEPKEAVSFLEEIITECAEKDITLVVNDKFAVLEVLKQSRSVKYEWFSLFAINYADLRRFSGMRFGAIPKTITFVSGLQNKYAPISTFSKSGVWALLTDLSEDDADNQVWPGHENKQSPGQIVFIQSSMVRLATARIVPHEWWAGNAKLNICYMMDVLGWLEK